MTEKEYQRYWRRVNRYGFTPEEAYKAPVRVPLWMFRIEIEEGLPFVEFLKREFAFGLSLQSIALSIDVKYHTLYHWVKKFKKSGLLLV